MNSLEKKVVKIESEIQAIKTSQKSKADSYRFYAYQTPNLYNGSYRTGKVIFHPYIADADYAIVFHPFGGTMGISGYGGSGFNMDIKNKNIAYFEVSDNAGVFNEFSICCISTMAGELQVVFD